VLVVLTAVTIGGVANFAPNQIIEAAPAGTPLDTLQVLILLSTVIVGFFATAGAAGADISMSSRSAKDIHLGGLVGIVLSTLVAGGLAVVIVAGAYGAGMVPDNLKGNLNPLDLMKGGLLDANVANVFMILLAISSFPGACFSAFIAATSFKTVMPKVNPWLSVGIGTLVSIVLAVTGLTGKVIEVFVVIGASFGPVCGAMMADYLLSGRKWAGPRAGCNPAGWISWLVGFVVGAFQFIAPLIPAIASYKDVVPCPPVAAFVVGFILYYVLAMIGLQSRTLEMPGQNA
jgi:cytosine permease